ncbi:MAG: sensor histidine kinase [Hyphomonadaceae bacterium]|nr:sensor histidine kinase [Hyphomonadaceae bacterium]
MTSDEMAGARALGLRVPALWPKELSLASLRGRLACLLALAFLPTGVLALQAGLAAVAARDAAVQQAEGVQRQRDIAEFRERIAQMRDVSRTLAANAELVAADRRRCAPALRELSAEYPDFAVISVLTEDARIECSNVAGAQGRQTAAGPLVARARATDAAIIGYVPAPRLSDSAVLASVARAKIDADAPALFVGVTQPIDAMLRDAIGGRDAAPGGYMGLAGADGALLAIAGEDAPFRIGENILRRVGARGGAIDGQAFPIGRSWAVASAVADGDLLVVRGWPRAPLSLAGMATYAWTLAAPVFLWLIAVGAVWLAVEMFVVRPLTVLERLAKTYARGEDAEAAENLLRTAPEEISSLRRTLAAMAKTLRGREARLATALHEERALLREVNHRVKNNLQMVVSILSIQSRAAQEAAEARGLARAKDRVQLLALAHTRIYASGVVHDVALDQLAGDVARAMIGSRGAAVARVRLRTDLAPLRTTVDRAVPFAFVIGECLSEALDVLPLDDGFDLDMRLAADAAGAVTFSLTSPASPHGAAAPAAQRLVDAFARQLNAAVVRGDGAGFSIRIEAAPAADAVEPERAGGDAR